MEKCVCGTCEHLSFEEKCEIKNIKKNTDDEACEKYEYDGYNASDDPYSFYFH